MAGGSAGVKRMPPPCSTAIGTVTIAAPGPDGAGRRPDPDARAGPVDGRRLGAEAHRQSVGEPRQVGAEPAGDEQVVGIVHAGEVVQAHLVEGPARDEPVDRRHPAAEGTHRRQRLRDRPVLGGAGRERHRPVRRREGPVERRPLGAPPGPAANEEMAVDRGPAQVFAAASAEGHEGVDRPRMQPVRAEVDRMPLDGDRHGASADPVPRLDDRHGEPRREETPRGGDPGGAGADHRHIRLAGSVRQNRAARERPGRRAGMVERPVRRDGHGVSGAPCGGAV